MVNGRSNSLVFMLGLLTLVLLAALWIREQRRSVLFAALEREQASLDAERDRMAVEIAAASAPIRETGFYRAERKPGPGLRPMALAEGGAGGTTTLYVAVVPDIVLSDIARVAAEPKGLRFVLTPAGRARFSALTRDRTAQGEVGCEAILIDGTLVGAPAFNAAITAPAIDLTVKKEPAWLAKVAQGFDRSP